MSNAQSTKNYFRKVVLSKRQIVVILATCAAALLFGACSAEDDGKEVAHIEPATEEVSKEPVYAVNASIKLTFVKLEKVTGENGKAELITVHQSCGDLYSAKMLDDTLKTEAIEQICTLLHKRTDKVYDTEQICNAVEVKETETDSVYEIEVTAADAEFCSELMEVILDVFPDYLKSRSATLAVGLVDYSGEAVLR